MAVSFIDGGPDWFCIPLFRGGNHDRDRMVVGLIITYAISAYLH
jgi:hypothetical protein